MELINRILIKNRILKWQRSSYIIIFIISFFLIWSLIAKFDEVAIATGEVVPHGRVKTIQHLEGGIIQEIYVSEGDFVNENSPLIQIDLAGTVVNFDELEIRLYGLLLKKARLISEAEGTKLNLPFPDEPRVINLRKAEEEAYKARLTELKTSKKILNGQIIQREQDIKELEVQLITLKSNLQLAKKRLNISNDLLIDQLTSPMEHLTIESEVESIIGDVRSTEEALPRARAALNETIDRSEELSLRFSREAREGLGETELNIARTEEILKTASEQQTRTTIKSPTTGIVKNLKYSTIGGVIKSGETIMDIVPSEDTLVIEAKLNPIDRGFVRAGQFANVKIDTFDYFRYGGISGEVEWVAADSSISNNGFPFFKVMIRTDQQWLGNESDGFLISPGMGATVDILTGKKSVLSYLIRPVLKLKHESFRER
ncbi:MAG: HlyD family type I secretion periplasmic adaptor subunit [Pseudomonadota bacterium]|nr:HlyD family type I secretion periplasmic adaptor subunit [Pseudomonadota bacterium]